MRNRKTMSPPPASLMQWALANPLKLLVSLLAAQSGFASSENAIDPDYKGCAMNFGKVSSDTAWAATAGGLSGARRGLPGAVAGAVVGGLFAGTKSLSGEADRSSSCIEKANRDYSRSVDESNYRASQYDYSSRGC